MKKTSPRNDRPPALEWMVAALGFVLVLAALGFLLHDAVEGDSSPPHLRVEAGTPVSKGENHLVPFTLHNEGGRNAANVLVEGTLISGGATETSSAAIGYAPAKSKAEGGLIFTRDPALGELRLRAVGFEEP